MHDSNTHDLHNFQITAVQASNNNCAATVLNLFGHVIVEYGMPSWVRGDHGGENIDVAMYMIMKNGSHHVSFMWGL